MAGLDYRTASESGTTDAADRLDPESTLGALWSDPVAEAEAIEGLDGAILAAQPPAVRIVAPLDGAGFASGTSVTLEGAALDAEDGPVADLTWSSELDGDLGSGASVTLEGLSEGVHIITLRGLDSHGLSSDTEISIAYGDAYATGGAAVHFGCR